MHSNPYPNTRFLFSEESYRQHTEPALQLDWGEYQTTEAKEIERDFRRLARALGINPGKLMIYGMVSAIELGYRAGAIKEDGETAPQSPDKTECKKNQ